MTAKQRQRKRDKWQRNKDRKRKRREGRTQKKDMTYQNFLKGISK